MTAPGGERIPLPTRLTAMGIGRVEIDPRARITVRSHGSSSYLVSVTNPRVSNEFRWLGSTLAGGAAQGAAKTAARRQGIGTVLTFVLGQVAGKAAGVVVGVFIPREVAREVFFNTVLPNGARVQYMIID